MGLVGRLLRWVVTRGLILAALAAVIVLVPGLPPYTTFTEQSLTPMQPREGILAPNNALDGVTQLMRDKLYGPEAFQVHAGELYTTLGSGELVKLSPGGHVTFVTKIGQPCEGLWQEHKCGRPLGFRIDAAGRYVYVADAYYGVWRVELATDRKQLLVSPRSAIAGRVPQLFNSLALARNGDFYWTDSSSDFQLRDGAYTSLVDPSGRLFHYNAAKNESRVLLDGLWFANGLALSPGEEFVIVAECLSSRIHRVYVNGPKKGQKDIFIDGLPGIPDNIQPLTDGSGVLVALYKTFDAEHPMVSRSVARFPLLRKLVARLQRLLEIPFEYLQQLYPHYFFEYVVYTIGHFKTMAPLLPKGSGIIQVDWSGKIVGAWFNQDGSLASVSDAIVYKDLLYLGSPHNPYLGTVPAPQQLKVAFSEPGKKSGEQPKASLPKATEPVKKPAETPKPAPARVSEPVKKTPEQPKTAPASKGPEPVKKPVEQPKPIEQPAKKTVEPVNAKKEEPTKPTVTQKTAQPKEVPKDTAQQKPKTEKPTEQPPTAKPTVQQAKVTDAPIPTTPKPAQETKPIPTEPPKKVETPKKVDPPKQVETPKKVEKPAKVETPKKPVESAKQKPGQIPIVEDIPVDTARPSKEPLKVIKREGPAEIPHPEL